MADFYDRMQGVATRLLSEKSQGVITYTPITPATNGWEDGTEGTPILLDAIAKGPAYKYLSELITTSDIEITASVFSQTPNMSGIITIDGVKKQTIAIKQIPAAGTPVCWKIWVKG